MLEARILNALPPDSELGKQWEALVQANDSSGFMQSLHWAGVKRKQGIRSVHLGVFDGKALLGGAIFYSTVKQNGVNIASAPEGPVLPWRDEALARQCLRLMIDFVSESAGRLSAMALRIEPRLVPPVILALREFERAPADLIPQETLYLDLTPETSALLAAMKPKGRYNIGVARRQGVDIKEVTDKAAAGRFYSIMLDAGERNDFAVEPVLFFEELIQALAPRGMLRLFFAEHEGDTLGAFLMLLYGQRATYLYGGISNCKRHLMAGYALQWHAIQQAKEASMKVYDFYGYDQFQSPEHEYARFSQFKSQFGGTVKRFIGAHDYFLIDSVADAFIRVVSEASRAE